MSFDKQVILLQSPKVLLTIISKNNNFFEIKINLTPISKINVRFLYL
jgi:hypothetical protein